MVKCSVIFCSAMATHVFPKDESCKRKWDRIISEVNKSDFTLSKCCRLCSAHFRKEDFRTTNSYTGTRFQRKYLKSNTIPTIFNNTRKVKSSTVRKELFGIEALPDTFSELRKEDNLDVEFLTVKEEVPQTGENNENAKKNIAFPSERNAGDSIHHNAEVQQPADVELLETLFEKVDHIAVLDHFEELGYNIGNAPSSDCVSESQSLPIELEPQKETFNTTGMQTEGGFYTIELFVENDEAISFYTGLESYRKFKMVFSTLSPEAYNLSYRRRFIERISVENQFFLVLMKLRRNTPYFELSQFFGISKASISNIFCTWINFLHQMWSMLDVWPSREIVQFYMPECFKKNYPTTRVIIDAIEVPIAKPSKPVVQQATWSTYKNRNTLKFVIGSTPGGLLSYCSPAYGGSTSDRQIFERSELRQNLERNDSIMADRGFNVQDICAEKDITVNIPTFMKAKGQLPALTVLKDRKLSSHRIHIERLIGLMKTYTILQSPLNAYFVPLGIRIVQVCIMLSNFREGIVGS